MYNAIAGSCAEQEANAGGAQIPFTIDGFDYVTNYPNPTLVTNCLNGGILNDTATDGTGNADRGVWIDFIQGATGTGKGDSTFGTASSPTRTTQTAHIRVSQVTNSNQNNPRPSLPIMVGGVITQGNMGSVSNIHWQTTSFSSSLSNGVTVGGYQVSDADEHNANNAIENDFILLITNGSGYQNCGIYDNANPFAGSSNSQFYLPYLVWGGSGKSNVLYPAINDTITIRITVDADIGGTTHTKIHDFIIKFI